MVEEYSAADVEAIIAAAKAALERDTNVLPLGFADTQLLEKLLSILPRYVGAQSDAQYIVGELRETLYSSVNTPKMSNIHRVCSNCTKCSAATSRAAAPLWEIAQPDLLLVMENPFVMKKQDNVNALVGALKTAGFSNTRTGCTFATRCEFPHGELNAEHYANCLPYLYHEIHAARPKLVITFGAPVFSAVTQVVPTGFKDIIGQISWIGTVAIMPLLSLNYLTKIHPKLDDAQASLEPYFKTAYNFCYGD